jgi:ribosome biogenesis GTPase
MQQLTARNVAAHACSCLTCAGLTDLLAALTGRRSVLAGASGVGKSTLVNALVPGANVATSPVRRKDNRGRHVTAAAKLHELPGGGVIVDTPGVRELALEMDAAELPWYFPEFAALTGRCRFNNCTHTHEPDCAVIAAVGAGTIPAYRYDGYLRILQTL